MKISLKNLGTVNKNRVILETKKANLTIYFSYETPICFALRTEREFTEMTRENDWKTTTGKFLNWLTPNKAERVNTEVFEKGLEKALRNF